MKLGTAVRVTLPPGHVLSALALMHARTGDARFKARADGLVAELANCQQALPKQGYHQGFLSAYREEFFDDVTILPQ